VSLILDALRRSEAERRRGQVPTLLDGSSPPRARTRSLWPVALGGLLGGLLLAGGLVWWLRPLPMPVTMALPQAPVASEPTAPLVLAAAPAPAAPAAPATPAPAAPAPAAPKPIAAAALPSAWSAPGAAVDDLPISDLQPSLRAALPPLRLSMHVYAEDPAQRFVIIDGQRLREGDALADGLHLLEVRREGLRLRWQDRVLWLPR